MRLAILGVGAILYGSGAYYIAMTVLGFWASALLATPVGWVIAVVSAVAGAISFVAYQRASLFSMLDPQARQFRLLKNRLKNLFSSEKGDFLQKTEELSEALNKKKSRVNMVKRSMRFMVRVIRMIKEPKLQEKEEKLTTPMNLSAVSRHTFLQSNKPKQRLSAPESLTRRFSS